MFERLLQYISRILCEPVLYSREFLITLFKTVDKSLSLSSTENQFAGSADHAFAFKV